MNPLLIILAMLSTDPVGTYGDADGNGVVDFNDIHTSTQFWGNTGPAWATHTCEVMGPPEPTPLERALEGAVVYTLEGWTVDGIGSSNEVLIRIKGENEDIIELLTNAKYGQIVYLRSFVGAPPPGAIPEFP